MLAVAAYALAVAALYLIVEPVLPRHVDSVDPQATAAPARPASAPARIPAWAWELHDWQRTDPVLRPPRPARAPKQVPRWYREWFAWRIAVSR